MEMVLTGRRVSGREAGEWGLGRVVEVGDVAGKVEVGREVLEGAVVMAREVCEGGPGAVGCGLRAVRGGCEEVSSMVFLYSGKDGWGFREGCDVGIDWLIGVLGGEQRL